MMNRTTRIVLIAALFTLVAGIFAIERAGAPEMEPTRPIIAGLDKQALINWPRNTDPLRALIVLTRFKGESPGDSLAPSWASTLFDGTSGSVNDYFTAISFGNIRVTGSCLPRIYEMPYDVSHYPDSKIYTQDILKMLSEDSTFSFADYDNDGPDGIPNSGDDDGYVDYLVLMPRSRPYDFIQRLATGVMTLPLPDEYVTKEKRPFGQPIIVDKYSGSLAVAATRAQAISILTAEIAHVYGGVDLMDKEYADPDNDSAGAGNWDVLAWGANGWGYSGIPAAPGAYNRMLMGCAGPYNANLVDVYGTVKGLRLREAGDPRGKMYRIMISPEEYFLIEHRSNSGMLYYDYGIPASGLLIWHVNERESNSTENYKLCDLECPDGEYRDAGYPKGEKPDPINGGDNLDFWAHDAEWTRSHYGNLGDATDVYDGVTYTSFGTATNPNSYSDQTKFKTGVEIFNIRREGEEMVFDCTAAYDVSTQPPKLPILGMGYQRSKNRTAPESETASKSVYLASRSKVSPPELMIAVSEDSLYTTDMTGKSRVAVQKAVDAFLLEGIDLEGVSVVRSMATPEELERVIDGTVARKPAVTTGSYRAIQKLTLTRSTGTVPFVMDVRQNYPNPFNNETTIPYVLSRSGKVRLEIFDILGRKVMERDEGIRSMGLQATRFSAGDLASGIYFYRIKGSDVSNARRCIILK